MATGHVGETRLSERGRSGPNPGHACAMSAGRNVRMARIRCKKCGATGISKNPYTRSVFLDNGMEAVYSWVLKYKTTTDEHGQKWLEVRMAYGSGDTDEAKAFVHLAEMLKRMTDEGWIEQYACPHGEWERTDGETEWDV